LDILSILGLVLAFCAILVGAVLKGAGIMSLVSAAAFMIVVVGTIAAILVQTPLHVMRRALAIFSWVMRPPLRDGQHLIARIVEWSHTARKQGLLGLEPIIEREGDPFVKKALQLLVDGSEPDSISNVMNVELHVREHGRQSLRGHGSLLADARNHRRGARAHGGAAEPC
jgi:chemotaxis protein MotA